MLSNLKLIIPALWMLAGGVLSSQIFALWDKWIDDPAIVREQTRVCLVKTQQAARDALNTEIIRQQTAADIARRSFETRLAARDAAQQTAEKKFEQEISDYAEKLKAAGRSCPIDRDTIEWLRGHPRPPDPRPG